MDHAHSHTWRSRNAELARRPGSRSKDPDHVFGNSAYRIYESKDGGQTWSRADKPIGDDWVNMAFDAQNNAVVTADRNLYRYVPKKSSGWLAKAICKSPSCTPSVPTRRTPT